MCKFQDARPQCVTFEGNSLISAEWCYACKMPLISCSNESLAVIPYPAWCKKIHKEKITVSAFNFIGHGIIPSQTKQMSDLWKICDAFCHKACPPYTLHCLIKNEHVCCCQCCHDPKAVQIKGAAAYQQFSSSIICPSNFFRKIKAFNLNCAMSLNTVIGNNTAVNAFFFASYRFPKLLIAM